MDKLSTLNGRRIALIGGAGFIGHHLALHLKRRGADVYIIDGMEVNNLLAFTRTVDERAHRERYSSFIRERLDLIYEAEIPLYIQDAQDYHALSRILVEINPQTIIHLAAVAHAGRSNKDPYSTFGNSLRTLENALDYARGHVEHFIYFSSSMAYGHFPVEGVSEDSPLNPIGIYGALKVAGEKMVIAYSQVFDLPYTIVRPSALYGPRCVSRRVGQIFIENAVAGAPLQIQGDGLECLDFTYITDLEQGIELTIERPEARNEIFNLTYGEGRSILDLVEVIKGEIQDVRIDYLERDHLVPVRGTLSIDKAKELLGYRPSHPIDSGFPEYVQWYREFTERSGNGGDG